MRHDARSGTRARRKVCDPAHVRFRAEPGRPALRRARHPRPDARLPLPGACGPASRGRRRRPPTAAKMGCLLAKPAAVPITYEWPLEIEDDPARYDYLNSPEHVIVQRWKGYAKPLTPGALGPTGLKWDDQKQTTFRLTADIVRAAGKAWNYPESWCDPLTVPYWLMWVMRIAHESKSHKSAFFRILARADCRSDPDGAQHCHELLRAHAMTLGAQLTPKLDAFFKVNKLSSKLRRIKLDKVSKAIPLVVDQGLPINQGAFLAVFEQGYKHDIQRIMDDVAREPRLYCLMEYHSPEETRAAVESMKGTGAKPLDFNIYMATLSFMAHYLKPGFDAKCQQLTGRGDAIKRHELDIKADSEMMSLLKKGHKRIEEAHKLTPYTMNLNLLRTSFRSINSDQQLEVWENIVETFGAENILHVKNMFVDEKAAEKERGLRYVLINVLYSADQTLGEMLDETNQQAIDAAYIRAGEAHPKRAFHYELVADVVQRLVYGDAELARKPLQMVVEIQIHLDFYVIARDMERLWWKVERSKNMEALKQECQKYRDRPGASGALLSTERDQGVWGTAKPGNRHKGAVSVRSYATKKQAKKQMKKKQAKLVFDD